MEETATAIKLPRSDIGKGVVGTPLVGWAAGMEETATAIKLPRSDTGKGVVPHGFSFRAVLVIKKSTLRSVASTFGHLYYSTNVLVIKGFSKVLR